MEVPVMEGATEIETHMSSAAAFVEGGIQDSNDDACSICLEEFSKNDPSTITNCKHEYHLQCILEWCQRSSQCPMCLQQIHLKDPSSQELLEAVEQERDLRVAPPRNATIFRHPTFGDIELQHLPIGATDVLEERILQHLAAAAAMGRTRHFARRESQRNRSSSHNHPHFLVYSRQPSGQSSSGHASSPFSQDRGENGPSVVTVAAPSSPLASNGNEQLGQQLYFPSGATALESGSALISQNHRGISPNNHSLSSQSFSLPNEDRAGPSEFQSSFESLKSRLNAVSIRYQESFSRSARRLKERFSRTNSMSDLGSEVRRDVNAGIASVSRMMQGLEIRDNNGASQVSVTTNANDLRVAERNINDNNEACRENLLNESGCPGSCATSSAST